MAQCVCDSAPRLLIGYSGREQKVGGRVIDRQENKCALRRGVCGRSLSVLSLSLSIAHQRTQAGVEDDNTTHPIAMAPVKPAAFITQDDDIVSFISLATPLSCRHRQHSAQTLQTLERI